MSRESRREFNHHHHRHLDVPVVRLVLVCTGLYWFVLVCAGLVSLPIPHSPWPPLIRLNHL
ncbi:MAG: hypothetical protein KC476_08930, partial [Cyanobacteria bacterium HKST-UBA06]|nr:hypothetical protein [Cyanobacteria bacterium HKST-UBA06]